MAIADNLLRYALIIEKLRSHRYPTLEDIVEFVRFRLLKEDRLESRSVGTARRTIERDFREIRNTLGFTIAYSAKEKGYYISNDNSFDDQLTGLLESFHLYNLIKFDTASRDYIFFEKRKSQGLENMYGYLHAIKTHTKLQICHKKFWEVNDTWRIVNPFALKEFNHRWYLIAEESATIKTFGLDRISEIVLTGDKFTKPDYAKLRAQFDDAFGIIALSDHKPVKIILSFDYYQGKFIKSLPLHKSQKILEDSEKHLLVSIQVFITDDLVMELLSYGDNVKIIQPVILAKRLSNIHKKAYEQYNKTE